MKKIKVCFYCWNCNCKPHQVNNDGRSRYIDPKQPDKHVCCQHETNRWPTALHYVILWNPALISYALTCEERTTSLSSSRWGKPDDSLIIVFPCWSSRPSEIIFCFALEVGELIKRKHSLGTTCLIAIHKLWKAIVFCRGNALDKIVSNVDDNVPS